MTRLSNRQYPMLELFAESIGGPHLTIDAAKQYDQRSFRSMLVQGWIAYHPGKGFKVTAKGKAAWEEFGHTDIRRKNPDLPLTAYFDPDAYKLHKRRAA